MSILKCIRYLAIFYSMTIYASYASDSKQQASYLILNKSVYQQIVQQARIKINHLLFLLQPYRHMNANEQIALITQQLTDIPYLYTGGMGEGDWQPTFLHYKPDALHMIQYPVYRLDGFDCQTFVQTTMALLYAKNLAQFDSDILKMTYGSTRNSDSEIVHYVNRNHFIEGDFNPRNQQQGWLTDVTSKGWLTRYAKHTSIALTRQTWFNLQKKNLTTRVCVLEKRNAPAMLQRFKMSDLKLTDPHFNAEHIDIAYLPKQQLIIEQADHRYKKNSHLFPFIPVPAVLEIVRDSQQWMIHGKKIKQLIGTELSISHVGLLYQRSFLQGELIYQRIHCDKNNFYPDQGRCHVTPIFCQQKKCNRLMFAHATDAYPNNYYWRPSPHAFTCAPLSSPHHHYPTCNRVEQFTLV